MNEQLKRIAQPVAGKFVKQKGRFSYAEHSVITQYLLAAVGPYDFQLVQVISDGDIITGAVCSLTCSIDGKHVTVQEAGDVEHPKNKPTNGARLKDAMSDAIKRCAMRLGLGLSLWAQENYFLPKALEVSDD